MIQFNLSINLPPHLSRKFDKERQKTDGVYDRHYTPEA